jgi:hypothetical protein
MTEQQKTMLRLLNLKWPQHQRVCGGCGKHAGNWEVIDTVQWMPFTGRNEIVVGGPCVPMIAICCSDCGWTNLWSAIRLGLIQSDGSAQQLPQGEVMMDRTGALSDWQKHWLRGTDEKPPMDPAKS